MAIDFKGPMERALLKIEKAVVDEINSGVPPPNAPSTVKRKKSSKTLIDSGKMRQHVDHKITGEGLNLRGSVGFFDEENAKKARINEEGATWVKTSKGGSKGMSQEYTLIVIPPRPFLVPGFDKAAPKAADEMAEEILAQIERDLRRR